MVRFYKIPKWLRSRYPDAIWDFCFQPGQNIYLTFDDGPHPETTPWILETLQKFEARATFFCQGKQARDYPDLLRQIQQNGHSIGNHGMEHLSGFKTPHTTYLQNVSDADVFLKTQLFRPPYGRIRKKAYTELKQQNYQIVFWDVMSYDFDSGLSSEKRLKKIKQHTRAGSIIVFHDSAKAFQNLKPELPLLLKYWKEQGFKFPAITP